MSSKIARVCLFGLGIVTMVCAMGGYAVAAVALPDAPEIDGATLSAGIAALSSAALILRSRRRSK